MTTFKTNRVATVGYIFKDWLISLGMVSLPVIYSLLFPARFAIKDSYFYIVGVLMLKSLFDKLDRDRLSEINFDKDKREIVFLYKSFISGPQQKTLSFDMARLEINEGKPNWWRRYTSLTLSFLKGRKEVFILYKNKDGFSVDTLRDICMAVENISLPVSKI